MLCVGGLFVVCLSVYVSFFCVWAIVHCVFVFVCLFVVVYKYLYCARTLLGVWLVPCLQGVLILVWRDCLLLPDVVVVVTVR